MGGAELPAFTPMRVDDGAGGVGVVVGGADVRVGSNGASSRKANARAPTRRPLEKMGLAITR